MTELEKKNSPKLIEETKKMANFDRRLVPTSHFLLGSLGTQLPS